MTNPTRALFSPGVLQFSHLSPEMFGTGCLLLLSRVRLGVWCILCCAPIIVIVIFHSSAPSTSLSSACSVSHSVYTLSYPLHIHFSLMLAFFWAKIEPAEMSKTQSQVVLFLLLFVEKLPSLLPVKRVFPKKLHMLCVAPLK